MDLDFDKAASRLKKEQKARIDKERQRREREAKAAQLAAERNSVLEEEARLRRAAQAAQAAEKEQARREEEERIQQTTGGVDFKETYIAVSLAHTHPSEDEMGDRVTLPASALHALQVKGAFETALIASGPIAFHLSSPHGSCTHAGVLEFVAEEGEIGLPRKVAACLAAVCQEHGQEGAGTRVEVRYVRLPKASLIRLQPHSESFAQAAAGIQGSLVPVFDSTRGKWQLPGLQGVLHDAIQPLSCLTEGDLLSVSIAGQRLGLTVLHVEPRGHDPDKPSAVSLLDTDVQVDLAASRAQQQHAEEQEQKQQHAEAAAARRAQEEAEERARVEQQLEERKAQARERLRMQQIEHEREGEGMEGDGVMEVQEVAVRLLCGRRVVYRIHSADTLQVSLSVQGSSGLEHP
jgi:hypothetical protein